eukprot:Pgem_evm1s15033
MFTRTFLSPNNLSRVGGLKFAPTRFLYNNVNLRTYSKFRNSSATRRLPFNT